jgi:hypothetical protein
LLTEAIFEAPRLYPPKSDLELRRLHECIIGSTSPDHHKLAVLYYVRKEFPTLSRQAAERLAKVFYLPEKYRIFVDGLWFLDRLKFEVKPVTLFAEVSMSPTNSLADKRALEFLTEPTLIPTYPEEILYTLCRHTPKNDCSLPLAYYQTVSPSITSQKVLEALFLVLCRSSITEAFFFSRAQGQNIHHRLFQKLIKFILAQSKGEVIAIRGASLMSLPLNEIEDTWITEYLKDGEGRNLPGAKDTMIMRGLTKGDLKMLQGGGEDLAGKKIKGVNWAVLKEGLQRGLNSPLE